MDGQMSPGKNPVVGDVSASCDLLDTDMHHTKSGIGTLVNVKIAGSKNMRIAGLNMEETIQQNYPKAMASRHAPSGVRLLAYTAEHQKSSCLGDMSCLMKDNLQAKA